MAQKGILLLSGGLDSTVSLVKATKEIEVVLALTFDYGQRAAKREIDAARAICRIYGIKHRVIKLPWLRDIVSTALVNKKMDIPTPNEEELGRIEFRKAIWVPNRNGLFVAIAASFAEGFGCKFVVGGFNLEEGEVFPDNSFEFVKAMTQSLQYSTLSNVKVISFVMELNKEEIVRLGFDLKVPFHLIWCCYKGEERMCGVCESCLRTIRAFRRVGKLDGIKDRFKGLL